LVGDGVAELIRTVEGFTEGARSTFFRDVGFFHNPDFLEVVAGFEGYF
jgi:hypothetical protein